MTPWEAVAVFAAGVGAGAINAVVGSGSLITFPTMLAVGFPPIVANVSNNVGLVPGGVTGVLGYRAELRGQRERLVRLGVASVLGSLGGGLLLLRLPAEAFRVIVPVLIGVACLMVVFQPRINEWLAARRRPHPHGGPWLWLGVLGAGVYGGYFGAAQGIVLIGLLGSFLDEDLQRVNAAKNLLSLLVNATAAVLFAFIAPVDWAAALTVALGSAAGGFLGARLGRRLPAPLLRGFIVVVGIVAIVKLVF
ncbi:sulfite exporter TauE/SafE family protein [Microbispora triticiradicis]|uniref:Probable membrane transporter protein n=3 Tax=Microbispora TaxID=2005 RepID=A0ABY3M6J3_9ACTN|nr:MULTISPECIES: sulfite exporter TauE/SafE family protein [Microbispora]RGA01777.1 sulfite exporter TauE/SafE family protein [Microbispora triticiradicis]TLP66854.1 sulfite exporter TauE/SafE family protein [Microbispora fusca]TYB68304.1 sulfite exporter TauE/SafE family protein [Microbispora tritici]